MVEYVLKKKKKKKRENTVVLGPGCSEDTTVRHSRHCIVSLSLKWFNCRH
jgi:hypothetical protein